ncbi:MAG: ATP-binding protein [Lachnospiraceae bacterium]|nr:ATP-binding protein [Lachnospiraceae bacterium]
MKKNPYSLTFGKEPLETIDRTVQKSEVIETFLDEPASQQIFMITGVRGCGKTVFMTEIEKEFLKHDEWIIAELNSSQDLMMDLAASLSSEDYLARIFQQASINLSFFGIGLEVKGGVPITNMQVAISKMLESMKKHKKKLLICIDEVTSTEYMRAFAGAFQIFVRQDLPVYLLMTGLYENINNLQNEKNLTFLYRAPKIELKPLNIGTIAESYKRKFSLNDEDALKMAKLTKGYSLAFQVLGYYTWNNDGKYAEAISEYRQYLEDYSYEKIWAEMSAGDRKLAYGLANSKTGKAKEIKDFLAISNNEYTPYRDRLVKRGILDGSEHGYIKFTLPLFEEYVLRNYDTGREEI